MINAGKRTEAEVMMKQWWARCLAAATLLVSAVAFAAFHLWTIEQIYSNADGTVQFVVLTTAFNGENLWAGSASISSTDTGGATRSMNFFANLPSPSTAGKHVLIATQGFADLGILAPDFIIPDKFISRGPGSVTYFASTVVYAALPSDGTNALYVGGAVAPNVATNFAGLSASVSAPPPATGPDLNQHGLTGSWFEPATNGQGFEIEVFPDLVAPGTGSVQLSWFTFDTVAGGLDRQRWYTLSGSVVSGQPNAALTIFQNTGGNFNAPPMTNGVAVGTAMLSFDTCSSGQLSYTFTDGSGRTGTIPLTRIAPNVTCSTTSARPTNADFSFSGNWFNAATSGQGFVAEVNPNNGAVFVPWYTYAPSGAGAGAAGQRWYTASGTLVPGSRSIPVQIFETTGGAFDMPTVPPPHSVPVGSGTLTFQSCSTATFHYNFTGGSSSGMVGDIPLTRIGPVPPGCTF